MTASIMQATIIQPTDQMSTDQQMASLEKQTRSPLPYSPPFSPLDSHSYHSIQPNPKNINLPPSYVKSTIHSGLQFKLPP